MAGENEHLAHARYFWAPDTHRLPLPMPLLDDVEDGGPTLDVWPRVCTGGNPFRIHCLSTGGWSPNTVQARTHELVVDRESVAELVGPLVVTGLTEARRFDPPTILVGRKPRPHDA